MIFNINNYVEIKLTQYGKDILKEKEDKIFTEYPSLKEYLYKYKVNNTGYLKLQLWEVMNIFGDHLGYGLQNPFEMKIRMEVKDVEVDQEEAKQIFKTNIKNFFLPSYITVSFIVKKLNSFIYSYCK